MHYAIILLLSRNIEIPIENKGYKFNENEQLNHLFYLLCNHLRFVVHAISILREKKRKKFRVYVICQTFIEM